jgi:CBS domain-containing protein
MQLKDIMTRDIEVISADTTIFDAAQKMKTYDIGILPVVDADQLIGMVTDRDIVVRVVAEGQHPQNTKVRDAMTLNIVYSFEDQDVEDAVKIMEDNQVRRIMVLNRNKQPVGIVSSGDIAVLTENERLSGELLKQVSEPVHVHR